MQYTSYEEEPKTCSSSTAPEVRTMCPPRWRAVTLIMQRLAADVALSQDTPKNGMRASARLITGRL